MLVTICGKRWRLRFQWMKKFAGHCDGPDVPNKQIIISTGMSEQKELDTIIHEAFHAADFNRREEHVNEFATDLARILWRLGWRKTKE